MSGVTDIFCGVNDLTNYITDCMHYVSDIYRQKTGQASEYTDGSKYPDGQISGDPDNSYEKTDMVCCLTGGVFVNAEALVEMSDVVLDNVGQVSDMVDVFDEISDAASGRVDRPADGTGASHKKPDTSYYG